MTTAAPASDELQLDLSPEDLPVVASAGLAAALSTNRQRRRDLLERRSWANVSVLGVPNVMDGRPF